MLIRGFLESSLNSIKNKIKRIYSRNKSLSYFLSNRSIEFFYIIGLVLMIAGIVNTVIQPVNPTLVISPFRNTQSILETMINALVLLLGVAGIYLSYLSGKQIVKPRIINFYLILGLLLITISISVEIYVYSSKL